jgi:hypothetical protein
MLFILSALSASSIILSSSSVNHEGLISQTSIPAAHSKFRAKKLLHFDQPHNSFLNPDPFATLNPNNKCKPKSFGIEFQDSQTHIEALPECKSRQGGDPNFHLAINETSRKVIVSCPGSLKPVVFAGPFSGKFAGQDFKAQLLNENSEKFEYLLGFCTDDPSDVSSFEEIDEKDLKADMLPIFNQDLFEETKLSQNQKIVVLISFDFLSRSHFFREFPETVKFLNETQRLFNYSVFDFKLFSIYDSTSMGNKLALLEGLKNFSENDDKRSKSKLNDVKSIWKMMKEKKFINFIGFDHCDRNLMPAAEDESFIDYSVQEFYCLLENQRFFQKECIGEEKTFEYLLKYSKTLLRFYSQNNIFINLNLGGPEDQTARFLRKYDKELMDFIREILIERASEQLLIIIQGDVGVKFEEFPKTLEEFQEFKLPALFLVTGKKLLDREVNSVKHLTENSNKLVSKLDLRKTILSFIGAHEESSDQVDFFHQVSSNSRDCSEVSLSTLHCPCSELIQTDTANLTISKIMKKVAKVTEDFLNKESHNKDKYCEKVVLDLFGKAFKIYEDGAESFLFELRSSKNLKVGFQVTVIISKQIIKRNGLKTLIRFDLDLFGSEYKGNVR